MVTAEEARLIIVDVYARGVRRLPGVDAVRVSLASETTFFESHFAEPIFWSYVNVDNVTPVLWIQVGQRTGTLEIHECFL